MVFEKIAELISERTGCAKEAVRRESSFHELGIDSLDTVELLLNLEDAIGVRIEPEKKMETVGQLATYVENMMKESNDEV